MKYEIVKDYKEVNRFLAGVLSGIVVRRHENMKKSYFVKLVLKSALRECIKNIITYNSFGSDVGFMSMNKEQREAQIVPFSH